MLELLRNFALITEDPYKRLAQWKDRTKHNVIGCLPMYTPEEIIHAADMLPITILAEDEDIRLAGQYIQPYLCSLVRAKFDMALDGRLDFLDGIVFPDLCDLTQQIPDIWKLHRSVPFQYSLGLVRGNLELRSRRNYLLQQFTDFKSSLEKCFSRQITNEQLRRSIAVYNHNRTLVNRLRQMRRSNPGLFHAGDMVSIVAASMLMPKEEHSELVSELVACVERRALGSDDKPKIVLSNLCDQPKKSVLDLIDQLGAVIVDDDLYTGSKYFYKNVDETLDPIEGLVDRYIHGLPCPIKSDSNRDLGEYLIDLAKQAEADGLIIFLVRFCEPLGFDYPYLKKRLSEAGIPHMLLETEVGVEGHLEQIRTRVQAFIEMLKGV
jgi:benzoyl-CoA reductase subunit C